MGFLIGGCIWGMIPLIIGLCKKRGGLGILFMAISAVCALIDSSLPSIAAIVSGVIILCIPRKESDAKAQTSQQKIVINSSELANTSNSWVCSKCKTPNMENVGTCQKCGISRNWSDAQAAKKGISPSTPAVQFSTHEHETTVPSSQHSPTSILLLMCSGPISGTKFRCREGNPVFIGRDSSRCNLVLTGYNTVSGLHCRIDVCSSGITVTDLGSTNGTSVGNIRLMPNQPASLPNGTELLLGNAECQFQVLYETPTEAECTENPIQKPTPSNENIPKKNKKWPILLFTLTVVLAITILILIKPFLHKWSDWAIAGEQMQRTCSLCHKKETSNVDHKILAEQYIIGNWNGLMFGSDKKQFALPAGSSYAQFNADGTYILRLNGKEETGSWEVISAEPSRDADYVYALNLTGDTATGFITSCEDDIPSSDQQEGRKMIKHHFGDADNSKVIYGNFTISD